MKVHVIVHDDYSDTNIEVFTDRDKCRARYLELTNNEDRETMEKFNLLVCEYDVEPV